MPHSCQQGGAEARDKGRNIYTISTSIYPGWRSTNNILFITADTQQRAGKSNFPRVHSGPDAVEAGRTAFKKEKTTHTHIKCFHFNRQRAERKRRNNTSTFPLLDLCDSITLNILSPEQAQLPSNRCSQPLMRLARGQRELPGLLIARLKSLYLIGPVIHKEMIQRGRLSETQIGSFDYQKQQGHRNKRPNRRPEAPHSWGR